MRFSTVFAVAPDFESEVCPFFVSLQEALEQK
jgi:hypothetical protein